MRVFQKLGLKGDDFSKFCLKDEGFSKIRPQG